MLAVLADEAWKDSISPLVAEGPVTCPNRELEPAGVLKAEKLGVAAAEAPEADGALKAPAPKLKGAAAPALPGELKRPPDGCGGLSAAKDCVLLLLLPQPNATGAGAVLAAPLKRGGIRAAWLVAAEGCCCEEPLRTGGTQLSGTADAAAVAESPATTMSYWLTVSAILTGLQHPVNQSALYWATFLQAPARPAHS